MKNVFFGQADISGVITSGIIFAGQIPQGVTDKLAELLSVTVTSFSNVSGEILTVETFVFDSQTDMTGVEITPKSTDPVLGSSAPLLNMFRSPSNIETSGDNFLLNRVTLDKRGFHTFSEYNFEDMVEGRKILRPGDVIGIYLSSVPVSAHNLNCKIVWREIG